MKNNLDKKGLTGFWRVLFLFLTAAIFLTMFLPMWNVFVVSTSTALDSSQSGIKLWWTAFSMEGFFYVFRVTKMARPFLNSLFITTLGTVIQVLLSALAGYVLIQKSLPFKNFISSFIMLTMMVPGDLTLISVYQLNKQLSLLNTYQGLVLNGLVSGFSIMMMRNYFETVPYSLAESARMDGAGELKIFGSIYMPISLPGFATVFFMEYVARWNSIMLPATLITDEKKYTLPLMLKQMIMSVDSTSGTAATPDNAIMAAIVISTIPLLIIYMFAQRFLMEGINMGAVKG
ncbi:carbohydrate ABC transporter permease [Lacrimispora sp.]|uniref:carbohydrate ABC transporter permease n=1 Tax=Lacrimispora sp. TaxID=2719234 RepID=UPI0028A0EB08|nr:carbohydrate ABC transporter permease [Lacrimispora sp.]